MLKYFSNQLKEYVQDPHENCSAQQCKESEEDEICRSLKMFAVRAAYSLGKIPRAQSIDSIMDEFSKNGYDSEEIAEQQQEYTTANYVLKEKGQIRNLKILRKKNTPKKLHNNLEKCTLCCVFCENNNEPYDLVNSHAVRDSTGRVECPKLRTYVCPICKATGDKAHTVKYCPQKPIITMEDSIRSESYKLVRSTYLNQGMKI